MALSMSDIKPRPEGYAYNLQPSQRNAVPATSEDDQRVPTPPAEGAAEPQTSPTDYAGPGGAGSQPAAMLETLPSDLLDNPLIFSIAKGKPAAVSAPNKSKDPLVRSVVKNAQPLVAAGFGIYQALDKKTSVLFNTQLIHPGDLQEADQQGKLLDLAPPFDTVKNAAAVSTPGAPVSGGAGAAAIAAPSAPESQPAPSVQNKLASIRGKNLTPAGPTGGAAPGAGNILNAILKPVV